METPTLTVNSRPFRSDPTVSVMFLLLDLGVGRSIFHPPRAVHFSHEVVRSNSLPVCWQTGSCPALPSSSVSDHINTDLNTSICKPYIQRSRHHSRAFCALSKKHFRPCGYKSQSFIFSRFGFCVRHLARFRVLSSLSTYDGMYLLLA
jgi:hypothetical protein